MGLVVHGQCLLTHRSFYTLSEMEFAGEGMTVMAQSPSLYCISTLIRVKIKIRVRIRVRVKSGEFIMFYMCCCSMQS